MASDAGSARGGLSSDPSFEDVYQSSWASSVRLAYLMTGSVPLAEDIVQDAFVQLRRAWDRVDAPAAYLRVSVVNGVRAHSRRQQVRERHRPTPPTAVLLPELQEVWDELRILPVRQRHALVLRYYDDLPYADIAATLECSLGTAKSLVHRGLERLREHLSP